MRIVSCREWLYKCERAINSLCTCGVLDTIEHYFIECKEIRPLWKELIEGWQNSISTFFTITDEEILFGIPNPFNLKLIDQTNYIMCLAKYQIYVAQQKGEQITVQGILSFIKKELDQKINTTQFINPNNKLKEEWVEIINFTANFA